MGINMPLESDELGWQLAVDLIPERIPAASPLSSLTGIGSVCLLLLKPGSGTW